jgi:hypothetical protein
VLIVCHGNVMEGFRLLLERMTQFHWLKLRDSKSSFDKIHNCQILWYSRRNPNSGHVHGQLSWLRSICPWDVTRSRNSWERLTRPTYANHQLLEVVHTIPQLVNNDRDPEEEERAQTEIASESFQALPDC